MMIRFDRTGILLQVSTFWAEKLGYQKAEMLGRKCTDFLMPDHVRYAEEEVFPRLFQDGRLEDIPCRHRRADGSALEILMSAVAQNDANGRFLQGLAILADNSEARRAMDLLHRKQRAESIGYLVSGVAHDFNNALSVIQGSLELLQDAPDGPDHDIHLMDALRAARRASTMTRQLLSIGRQDQMRPQSIDINEIVGRSSATLGRLMPETIDVESVTTSRAWPVRVDPYQLETAILTLANNARLAMPHGGTLTIETGNIRLREPQEEPGQDPLPPGRYVMLAVSDSGFGINREHISRIWEPHYTTREDGEGTGMGLAMVQHFVRQHKGAVRLHSEVGFGTTVKLYFPASSAARATDSFHDSPGDDAFEVHGKPEVLVVEDEDDVRRVLVAQLRTEGYRVAEATNGDFALTLLENGFHPSVLVTDVVMPGRYQGPSLADRARELVPTIKVVFISGYVSDHDSTGPQPDIHLVKPVGRNILAGALKNLLA